LDLPSITSTSPHAPPILANRARSSQFLPLPSDAQHFTGDLTYYGPGLGACGVTSTDQDYIVSVSHDLFDAESTGSNPNNNPLCGLMIRAQRIDGRDNQAKSIDLKVVDRCKYSSHDWEDILKT
jgi:hypothetical protein